MNKKRIIIIAMCLVICLMIVGYAVLGQKLNINGTADIESNWNILFTNVSIIERTTGVTFTSTPTISGTTLTFGLDLKAPGDGVKLDVTVANRGTIDAIINEIEAIKGVNDAIKIEVTGIKKGDKLAKGQSKTFGIYVVFDSSVTDQPTLDDEMLSISVNFVQDVGQTITSEDVEVVSAGLAKKILKDNTPHPLNTAVVNGAGLYEVNENTEDNKTTYIFSGTNVNNYVSFAGKMWRIIRINEDGSIRIILNVSAGKSAFNTSPTTYSYNPLVGYMYGNQVSTSISSAHANVNSSTVKTFLDNWYKTNLLSYSNYIADAGFCGDRTYTSGSPLGNLATTYTNSTTVLDCPQENDLYTTTTATKGNKALTYPIGLMSTAEFVYTSKVGGTYLSTTAAEAYWTMTPSKFDTLPYVTVIYMGVTSSVSVDSTNFSVLPVINLKDTVIVSGSGTSTNPYVVITK